MPTVGDTKIQTAEKAIHFLSYRGRLVSMHRSGKDVILKVDHPDRGYIRTDRIRPNGVWSIVDIDQYALPLPLTGHWPNNPQTIWSA